MRNGRDRFFFFLTTRLSRADSDRIGVCDCDRCRVKTNRPHEVRTWGFDFQCNNSDTCATHKIFPSLRDVDSSQNHRARTKHHFPHKIAARRRSRLRARGWFARHAHRTCDRGARRRRAGRGDDDGVGATNQRAPSTGTRPSQHAVTVCAHDAR